MRKTSRTEDQYEQRFKKIVLFKKYKKFILQKNFKCFLAKGIKLLTGIHYC